VDTFDKNASQTAVAELRLEPANAELVRYWFELWPGANLPDRAAFQPAKFKSILPNIVLFSVVPDEGVTVRLAGTRFNQLMGEEMTGKDWLAEGSPDRRAQRFANFCAIARGAVMLGHRRLVAEDGDDVISQEIVLPFAAGADGVHPVLGHSHLSRDDFLRVKKPQRGSGDGQDYQLLELPRI